MGAPSLELFALGVLSLLIFVFVSAIGIPLSVVPFLYALTLSFRRVVISLSALACALTIGLSPREPLLLIPVAIFLIIFARRIVNDPFSNGAFGMGTLFGLTLAALVWFFGV